MSSQEEEKLPPLESGLITAMRALDSQIDKEVLRRNPSEMEEHGVQKWEPIDKRIERVCALVLDWVGQDAVKLESVLVLSQAMTKSLKLIVEDLGEESLGKVRANYCTSALDRISRDAHAGLALLEKNSFLS